MNKSGGGAWRMPGYTRIQGGGGEADPGKRGGCDMSGTRFERARTLLRLCPTLSRRWLSI